MTPKKGHLNQLRAQAISHPASRSPTSTIRLVRSHAHVSPVYIATPNLLTRLFDIAMASALTTVFLPIILITVATLLLSKGPVIFHQDRLGYGGRAFRVYKFRTMIPDAQKVLAEILAKNPALKAEWERDYKLKKDPRVTWIGRLLRRTSLDELPQLWNIFKGDMSIVGPRPIEPFEIARYGRFARHYYAQRPGLTGLWQVSGRSDTSYQRRVILDTYYSKKKSLLLDVKIIARTVRVVLFGSGAY